MPISGAWFARTPMEPGVVRDESISISSSKTLPSGVRTSTWNLFFAIVVLGALGVLGAVLHLRLLVLLLVPAPGRLDHVVDRALQQEGALGDVVVLAVDDLLEGADRVLDGDVDTGRAGELLGDEERLREEALDLAGALHGQLVLV